MPEGGRYIQMLELKGIVKNYAAGDMTVNALRGIDLRFRRNEFVSILGPSGCGKTTLLNIIGGLDKYTEGDLVINGRSTKDFRDRDWDAYRNHSIGFVFQSYNLIPHQTVLQNVELSLTLSGIPKAERKARAIKALEDVGLGTQLRKKVLRKAEAVRHRRAPCAVGRTRLIHGEREMGRSKSCWEGGLKKVVTQSHKLFGEKERKREKTK